MIYLTQLIYIREAEEESFKRFESLAIPLISKYNGKLLLRVRPSEDSFIEAGMEKPYEIHFVEFESEEDFERFKRDKEREKYLHLKEQSIRSVFLVQGSKI